MDLLVKSVEHWDAAGVSNLFVTVDGGPAAHQRVTRAVSPWCGAVFRVGGSSIDRLGVAANKNTGLELLMDNTGVDHLFLSDDDTWPLHDTALYLHTSIADHLPHSMLCWGPHRLAAQHPVFAEWLWPRGCVLFMTREVVLQAGGMVEEFGVGGHEHVEYSARIARHGMSPEPFCSPPRYALDNAYGARALWHAEDMPLVGEAPMVNLMRRKRISSMNRPAEAEALNTTIMAERAGRTDFVPYRARENGRPSATLYPHT